MIRLFRVREFDVSLRIIIFASPGACRYPVFVAAELVNKSALNDRLPNRAATSSISTVNAIGVPLELPAVAAKFVLVAKDVERAFQTVMNWVSDLLAVDASAGVAVVEFSVDTLAATASTAVFKTA